MNAATPSAERVKLWRPVGMDGVEVMDARAATRLWRVYHATVELYVFTRGGPRAGYETQFRRWRFENTPGVVSAYQPGEVHADRRNFGPVDFRVVSLDADWWARTVGAEPGAGSADFGGAWTRDGGAYAALAGFHRVLDEPDATTLEKESRLVMAVRAAAGILPQARAELDEGRREPAAVGRAKDYIHAHLAQNISLDELSRAALLSKYHLVRTFERATGMPPHAYLVHLRLARARVLLRGGLTGAETAYRLGFADQAHLNRFFRRAYGVTPGQFVRERR